MPPLPTITGASWIMVATLGFVWGATFMMIELALPGITPFWLAAYRIGFATILTGLVWLWRGPRLFLTDDRPWGALSVIGVLSTALPFMCLGWGQQYVTSGYAGVTMAAVALIVLPMAHFLLPGERMTLRRGIGFAIGFVGVVVLIGPEALTSSGHPMEPFGRFAVFGAACCYAISSVTMRRLPAIDPIGLAAVPLVIGSAFVVPLAWLREGPPPLPDTQTLLILAVLGLFPTAGANLLRVLVIRSAGPVFMSLTNYQVPLWSVALGVIVLGEPLRQSLLIALVLILTGVLISQWQALKSVFGRPNA